MNLNEAYRYCIQFLEKNGIDEADFKALCIICSVVGIKNSEYPLHKDDYVHESSFFDMLLQLKCGKPLQYVIGKWDFYDSEFFVGDGVLIPRPETEELIDFALTALKSYNNPVIYDLCAGSGCIGRTVAAHFPTSKVFAIEKSAEAFTYLTRNCNNMKNMVLINGDIYDDFDLPDADVILSNPPYIRHDALPYLQNEVKHEPEIALDGGEDGFDFYRIICEKWMGKLKSGGILIMEIGNEQAPGICQIFSSCGNIEIKKDMYGNDRIAVITKDLR